MDFINHLQNRLAYINKHKSQHRWTISDRYAVSALLIHIEEMKKKQGEKCKSHEWHAKTSGFKYCPDCGQPLVRL